jgi:hypothetical protein
MGRVVKNQIVVQAANAVFFECLKCKFELTNNLYNQLVAFLLCKLSEYNFPFIVLPSKPANIATGEKYSIHSVLQSAAHLSALCLLT